jgi:Domain of unknown function (DUF222)
MNNEALPRPPGGSLDPMREPIHTEKQLRNDELADEIAELSAQIQAADYRLLTLIREFDDNSGWVQQGAKTCAQWLSWRIGLAPNAARERLRVAHALEKLPGVSEAMRKGDISYSKVRAVTRVATPDNESQLLTIAQGGTAAQVERVVRAWRKIDAQTEREHARYQQSERSLRVYTDDDGMVVVRGRLSPEVGAVLMKALEAAGEVLYKEEKNVEPEHLDEERSPEQRKADALELVAKSALASGLDPGSSAERYQVVVHVDESVLQNPENPGQSVLELGTGVSAETSRRLACDASVVEMKHDAEGNVLDVGRKRRTIPVAIRRALDARDPTCVWPGCDGRFVHGHHVKFWAEGGETKLDNLCNLCSRHHHLVHDGGYKVERLPEGSFRFVSPRGREIPAVPRPKELAADPVQGLTEKNDLTLEGWEGKPKWGFTTIRAQAINDYWNNARRYAEERSRDLEGNA